jgi:acyl-[acyl-carrier-protein]-phospholipid O-acyltransferase/long-chain-fatty-acid--[acyl-carrier-protein] ligase
MVAFGKPLPPEAADIATVREELLKIGEFCYSQRPVLRDHLSRACLRGLKRNSFRSAMTDGLDHTTLSRGKLLGLAVALSRYLKRTCPERRIGIVLPPSKGAVIANLAVALAGKIPVNLNFTSARDSIESAKEQAGLSTIITARLFARRLEDFPWTPQVIHLDETLPKIKRTILGWWLLGLAMPTGMLARVLNLPRAGDHAEAILLFTSGSSGKPKGVALSHRNILANVSQFGVMLDAKKDDVILASLPFFHSFGCTVTLWYPLIEGVRSVSYPNPLEAGKIARLVERYSATVMLATPTFLRAYLRKAEPPQLRSLRLLITGAEKLPDELAKSFEARFGKEVLQGYGLTETSPVVSVNLPEPKATKTGATVQPSNRLGSAGKLLPGMAAEIRDPETDQKGSLHETGMLWLRGSNIFEGYLDAPQQTAEVLREGWFKTGDIGRFDEDGFLYIEGRLSRFSKIGGEMVPHEALEQKILTALGLDGKDERLIAIVGVSDESKGEAVVLLSAVDVDLAQLRPKLNEAGVPNLWIPKKVCRIDSIPVLASGKLDLGKCKELVVEK